MKTMMNGVMTNLRDEELLNINGGIILYVSDTGKYWAFTDDGGLFHPDFSYDQQSAIELARRYGWSTQLYTKENFMAEFGYARCFDE